MTPNDLSFPPTFYLFSRVPFFAYSAEIVTILPVLATLFHSVSFIPSFVNRHSQFSHPLIIADTVDEVSETRKPCCATNYFIHRSSSFIPSSRFLPHSILNLGSLLTLNLPLLKTSSGLYKRVYHCIGSAACLVLLAHRTFKS